MILIATSFQGYEGKMGAEDEAPKNFGITPFQSKENALFIKGWHCKKGTFAFSEKGRGPDPQQACSQACVSGEAKLFWRNHVLRNLRSYCITIKWIICVQEKIESNQHFRRSLHSYKDTTATKKLEHDPPSWATGYGCLRNWIPESLLSPSLES